MLQRRSIPADLLALTLLCALTYALLPTSHGLTNWQEAKRALVAREMHDRLATDPLACVVPTENGKPYLAKPPLIYWAQIAIAKALGRRSGELELRLTVAIAGWLGVLCTYLTARRLLSPWDDGPDAVLHDDRAFAEHVAWWSSLLLATGILYVRSSRIGELDILLVPFTVAAIGCIARAWRFAVQHERTPWLTALAATALTTGAVLVKGPPAVLTIALAGYGGIAVNIALNRAPARRRAQSPASLQAETSESPSIPTISQPRPTIAVASVLGFMTFAIAAFLHADSWRDIAGITILGLCGSLVGTLLALLADRARLVQLWTIFSRTHPVMVLGGPLLVFYGWTRAVAHVIGTVNVATSLGEEVEDNLRLFVPESPLVNLEAASYGVGLGSICAALFIVWFVRTRPVLPRTWIFAAAWVVLGLVGFSTLGKGVPRYLTPLWPGIAILGATWLTSTIRDSSKPMRLASIALSIVVTLAAGQSWWYAFGREMKFSSRSPRAFISELHDPSLAIDFARLGTFEFSTPQLDFYANRALESFHDTTPRPGIRFVGPRTITDLRADLADGSTYTLLIRAKQPPSMEPRSAEDCLSDVGLLVEKLNVRTPFTIDNGRVPVIAVGVRAALNRLPLDPVSTDTPGTSGARPDGR